LRSLRFLHVEADVGPWSVVTRGAGITKASEDERSDAFGATSRRAGRPRATPRVRRSSPPVIVLSAVRPRRPSRRARLPAERRRWAKKIRHSVRPPPWVLQRVICEPWGATDRRFGRVWLPRRSC